jgi:Putative rhamnosyl transferase
MCKHFVITRFGLGVYCQHWFESMLALFECTTLVSLRRQSDPRFVWLIAIDAHMPSAPRRRLEALLAPHPNFHVVQIDVTQLINVKMGSFDWIWDKCQDFIIEKGLLDDPAQYVVTSTIDADDAWHYDVVDTVANFMRQQPLDFELERKGNATWLGHSAGRAATLPLGYRWFVGADAIEPMESMFHSTAVFVAARFSSGISACSSRHSQWPHYANVVDFKVASLPQVDPMWLYIRHHRTVVAWDGSRAPKISDEQARQIEHLFGVAVGAVRDWRSRHEAASGSTRHDGCSITAQFDRFFQLAGLNRQIRALQRRWQAATQSDDVDVRNNEELKRAVEAREKLLEVIRQAH